MWYPDRISLRFFFNLKKLFTKAAYKNCLQIFGDDPADNNRINSSNRAKKSGGSGVTPWRRDFFALFSCFTESASEISGCIFIRDMV